MTKVFSEYIINNNMNAKRFVVLIGVLLFLLLIGLSLLYLKTKDKQTTLLESPVQEYEIGPVSDLDARVDKDVMDEIIRTVSEDKDTPQLKIDFLVTVPAQEEVYIYNSKYPIIELGGEFVPDRSRELPVPAIGCAKPKKEGKLVTLDFFVFLDEIKSVLNRDEINLIANNLLKSCVVYALRGGDLSEEKLSNLSLDISNSLKGKNLVSIYY